MLFPLFVCSLPGFFPGPFSIPASICCHGMDAAAGGIGLGRTFCADHFVVPFASSWIHFSRGPTASFPYLTDANLRLPLDSYGAEHGNNAPALRLAGIPSGCRMGTDKLYRRRHRFFHDVTLQHMCLIEEQRMRFEFRCSCFFSVHLSLFTVHRFPTVPSPSGSPGG